MQGVVLHFDKEYCQSIICSALIVRIECWMLKVPEDTFKTAHSPLQYNLSGLFKPLLN